MKKYLLFTLIILLPLWGRAEEPQVLTVAERNAQQGFNDTIDRQAEDFVTVSLCVADPTTIQDDALGVTGHAFLRLQCPVFGLDYCFSYEGERVNDNLYRYMSGKTKMGMFAIPTDEYLEDYRQWKRSVHEYRLALSPEAEQRLWEIMDNHITGGIVLRQDLSKYGCAITVVRYVKKALVGTSIDYAPEEELNHLSRREIAYRSLAAHPWLRLSSMLFTDNRFDRELPIDEKLTTPADLAAVWQRASLNGQPFAVYVGDMVQGEPIDNSRPWFTPMVAAILILLLTLGFAFTRLPYWDWLLLGIQAVLGVALIVLCCIMGDMGNAVLPLLVLLNPLPLLLWRWHRYWALPYAALLLVGVLVLLCLPHMLIDPALLVLALSYGVLFVKEPVKNRLAARR